MSFLDTRAAEAESVIAGVDPTKFTTSNPFRLFIIQAIIIIAFTRLLGYGLAKIRQPTVIAEVIGGIILGPTVMERIPQFSQHIFPPQSLPYLNLVSTLGLTLFLFLVGLEVDLRVMRRKIKVSGAISFVGLAVPFSAGAGLAKGIYDNFVDRAAVPFLHFALFVAVATSITAFPVLARILTETKLLYTDMGVTTLAAGVGNDVVGWILLALTVALVNASSGLIALWAILCIVGWALILFLAIRPIFLWLARRTGSLESSGPTQLIITITLLLVFVSAWITDIIGVHAIFGAFLVGIMVPHEGGLAVAFAEKIEDLVSVVFLPIYFTLSGLKTDLGDLSSGIVWGYTILIIVVAFASKFLACSLTARLCRFNNRESAAIGTLMACKGLVELIVLNIGLSAGVLNTQTFSMFVLMAIVTTVATTPLTLWAYPERLRKQHQGELHGEDKASKGHGFDGNGVADGDEEPGGDALSSRLTVGSKRIMVVLTCFEHLPSLMSLVQLVRPSHATLDEQNLPGGTGRDGMVSRNRFEETRGASGSSSLQTPLDGKEGSGSVSSIAEQGPQSRPDYPSGTIHGSLFRSAPMSFDALRLVELTDRTSAVMRVAENENTMRADPISNVFRTFAQLNRLPVRASMSVVAPEQFPSTLISRAKSLASDFVILPWTMPFIPFSLSSASAQASEGIVSALSSPFDIFFGRSASAASADASGQGNATLAPANRNLAQQTVLARKLIQTAECDVGLLITSISSGDVDSAVDSGRQAYRHLPSSGHIVLAFMGGPDDRVALNLAAHFCAVNQDLRVTVLHMKRADTGEGSEPLRSPKVPSSVHHHTQSLSQSIATPTHAQGLTMQDSLHRESHQGHTRGPTESLLLDDLAVQRIRNAPRFAQALDKGRLRIETVEVARPLKELLGRIEALQPSLVIVGRGRQNPTMRNHRNELSVLLALGLDDDKHDDAAAAERKPFYDSTIRLMNSDTCKVLGEVAFALNAVVVGERGSRPSSGTPRRGVSTPAILVVASSYHRNRRQAEKHGIDDIEQAA